MARCLLSGLTSDKVFAYLQRMQQERIALGYVETILGRRRYSISRAIASVSLKPQAEEIDLDSLRGLTAYDAGC